MIVIKRNSQYFLIICLFLISRSQCIKMAENNLKIAEESTIEKAEEIIPKNIPCPPATDIYPCMCDFDENYNMTIDCSDVTSERELHYIFNREFLFYDFYELKIWYNGNLDDLKEGVFGNATFEKVNLYGVGFISIDSSIFNKMNHTLKMLYITNCGHLDRFEFDFENFQLLEDIALYNNDMSLFDLVSPTVIYLNLLGNELNESNFYLNAPNLKDLTLYYNKFKNMPNISSCTKLEYLSIDYNEIQKILEGEICYSNSLESLSLTSNNISSINVSSICVKNGGWVALNSNQIVTLDEANFKSILVNVRSSEGLYLQYNPLQCGCDIYWLFSNDYMEKIDSQAKCVDGQYLHDLDPTIYDAIC